MARDTGLMDRARVTGEAVFSVYSWARPTLSLGRNQAAAGRYDLDAIGERGIDVVRRPTGGRALLHRREVTYSVTSPIDDADSLRESYERINRILLDGLARVGVNAREARGGPRTPEPGELPCFAAPAEGELTANGSKLVGSAQFREDGALLQHGSILIADDQPIIAALLKERRSDLSPPPAATLSDALGREPSFDEVAGALFDAVTSLEDDQATELEEAETAGYTRRHIEHYENALWTWRR